MRVVAIVQDLILFSRVDAAAAAGSARLTRLLDSPSELPPANDVDLLLVDWSARGAEWADAIAEWRSGKAVRVIAFGRHTDLVAPETRRCSDGPPP